MKYLLIILAIVFASCGSTHKIKTSHLKNVDRTTVSIKDSSKVTKEHIDTDNFVAKGVDISFDYGDEPVTNPAHSTDSVKWKPYYYNPTKLGSSAIDKVINQAIASSGLNGHIPNNIKIHIDSMENLSSSITKIDSFKLKDSFASKVKLTEKDKSKTVDKKGLGLGGSVIVIIIGAIILFLAGKKLKII